MKNIVEVLAPVGDSLSFDSAINSGADAIYLGLNGFNARAKAENFNINSIRDVVKKAHLFGVKVYVTLNTLVADSEFDKLLELVDVAYMSNVDAFIIQDLGVAKLLKDRYKNIVLHASTQMGINNLYGAKIAEKLGFQRVVVSRETTLEDIKQIKENTNLEIEYFVQGALCVAFSGNCYFSSLKHNMSGNRGKCLQLCRLKYDAIVNGKKLDSKYYLSTKDLCLLKNIESLINAGVCSFKIEGRLRRPAYVFQAVNSVKNVINALNKKVVINDEYQKLRKVFVRGLGFNENAYLHGECAGIIDSDYNNHTGIKIGIVKEVLPFKNLYQIIIKSKIKINENDGLKFYSDGDVISLGVGNVEVVNNELYKIYSKHKPKLESEVYLTLDYEHEKQLLERNKKLDIKVNIKIIENQPCVAEISFGDLLLIKESDFVLEKAINAGLTKEKVIEQFSKVSETEFNIKEITVELKGNAFASKSNLNKFRNELLKDFKELIIIENEKGFNLEINKNIIQNNYNGNALLSNFNIFVINEISQLNCEEVNENDLVVYFPIQYSDCDKELNLLKNKFKCNIGLKMPALANSKDLIIIDKILENNKYLYLFGDNIYSLYYADLGYKIVCSYSMNVYNSITANVLNELGAIACVKTVEHVDNGIVSNSLINFVYGKVNLMHFAHCPYRTVFNISCENCMAKNDLKYSLNGKDYKILKFKISKCYFYLRDNVTVNKQAKYKFGCYDLTN